MEVTAKSADGKFEQKQERHYHTQATSCRDSNMAYGAQTKASYVRDTTLQPFQYRSDTFEFDLPVDDKGAPTVRAVDVTVELNYEINVPENKITIHKISRGVSLDR